MSMKVNCEKQKIGCRATDRFTGSTVEILDILEGQKGTWFLCLNHYSGTTVLRQLGDLEGVISKSKEE